VAVEAAPHAPAVDPLETDVLPVEDRAGWQLGERGSVRRVPAMMARGRAE
jgi:hypothetical protein